MRYVGLAGGMGSRAICCVPCKNGVNCQSYARTRIQCVVGEAPLGRRIEIQRLENPGEHLCGITLVAIFKTGMEVLLMMKPGKT